ncbi:11207_t:CDS:2 [Acaulospora colombiana]|uniref:11207_t:CDS:1 n=1 Tax=Acaulospora colombiana TaxID=27376 RepID=A0ACA9KGE5_9GLOM|nr:11207_t:CDS:2 [Acaulospora colombiana]
MSSTQNFLSEYQEYLTANPKSILKSASESDEESDGDASTISFTSNSSSRYTDTTCVESPLSTSPNDDYCFTTAYDGSLKLLQHGKSRRSSVASRISKSSTKRRNTYRPNLWKYSSISTCNSLEMTPKALSSITLSAPSKVSISTVGEATNAFAMFSFESEKCGPGDSIEILRSQLNGIKERSMVIKGSRDITSLAKMIAAWSESIPFLSIFASKEKSPVVVATCDNNDNHNKGKDSVVTEETSNAVVPTEVAKVDGSSDNKVTPRKDQFKLFELFVNIMTNGRVN